MPEKTCLHRYGTSHRASCNLDDVRDNEKRGEPLPSWSEGLDNDFEADNQILVTVSPRLRVYPSKRTVAQCLAFQVTIFNIK